MVSAGSAPSPRLTLMRARRTTRKLLVGHPPGPSVATLAQIYALAGAGCDIVRCTCNEEEAAEGLAQIVPRSPVPIVADIHFQYKLALAAIEAGVQALRLNPGNIRKPEHIKLVASA